MPNTKSAIRRVRRVKKQTQINKIRKASEFHKEEQEKELVFVRQMYGIQSNAEAGV